ncbi:MAG: aldo/keto reductase [Bauldia sp.]|nr:aldo/keto reductase [Bauldia sp.]
MRIFAGGADIPAIGFGTWRLRGDACAAAVVNAVATGYRHIDTAAIYDNEEAVGEGIRTAGVPRGELFVVTKVSPDDIGDGDLQRSAEASLRRLGLDEVDLLLIHWPSSRIPLAESIGALNDARARGLTRHIGVSNFDAALLREACRLSAAPIVADQCPYHPRLDQSAALAECRRQGVAFVSYSPLQKRAVLDDPVVTAVAASHGRTPAQTVLRWHLQQGCAAIPKSADPARIRENFAVFDFVLDEDEMLAISRLGAGRGRPE